MKTILISFLLAFSAQTFALNLSDLHAGDVLALSFNCYECRMIESETNSDFSHTGVVIVDEEGRTRVAQSLGKLDHFSYEQFTKPMTPGTRVHVYRPVEFKNLSNQKRQLLEKNMLDVFNEKYKGAPFDSRYLWNNFDSKGRELLYCSEFIAKFLDNFLSQKTIPMPLTYDRNYAYWLTYFRGNVPEGELGNGPASFSRDSRFEFIGTL